MNRRKKSFSFPVSELENIKRRMLHWAHQCNILLFLDSNEYKHTAGSYECIMAVNAVSVIENDDQNLTQLNAHQLQQKDWLFGHINYDFKNKLEKLGSNHSAHFEFEDLSFFQPEIVCYIPRNEHVLWIESLSESPELLWQAIFKQTLIVEPTNNRPVNFEKNLVMEDYLGKIAQLKKHIVEGDCYEINFCNEAHCLNADINPLNSFERLNKLSKAPFAAYYKQQDQYLLCASPERYLRKEGEKIMAQPIKGTARRSSVFAEDEQQKVYLCNSIKERAENVMIVDLMRNDLARCCTVDTVQVEELCGIYTFPQVHQMISTITGNLKPECSLFDALRLSFPMGSMTGAPKIIVMQLIEQYELARRELFSGCVGYISPEGDFDFNVVIRSLFYNQKTKYLSYQTGGAITHDSDPVQEWEETLLKAKALEQIFQLNQ